MSKDINSIEFSDREQLITNLIFRLADVLYIILDDNLKEMHKKGLDLRHEARYRFKKVIETSEASKKAYLTFTKDIQGLNDSQIEQFIIDSNILRQFILLLSDRIVGNKKNIQLAWDYLFSLPSNNILNINKDDIEL